VRGIASGLDLELIREQSGLLDLAPEWRAFADRHPAATPFHRPDWLITWWKHFGNGELRVFVFRDGCEVCGVIPCFLHEWQGRRQLTLLGSGISDYLEPLLKRDHVPEILALLSDHLRNNSDWDVCDWQDLSSPSVLAPLGQMHGDSRCSEIPITGKWDNFYLARPRGLRRNLRRYTAKARIIDDVQFFVKADFEPELVSDLIRLHAARWNREGEAGMIAANRSAGFLHEIASKFASRGMLRFFGLKFQGRVVALILSVPYKNVLFAYLSAFDPEYEQYGFGKLLLQESLKHAFQERYASWNFLRGEEQYKFDWGARAIAKSRLKLRKQDLAASHTASGDKGLYSHSPSF
jgi:CelD/BcsL family acetyltransferase involved in cellulose biosynthesis